MGVAQQLQQIDLAAIGGHGLLQLRHALLERRRIVDGLLKARLGLAGPGQQLVAPLAHLSHHLVAATGRHLARRLVQRLAQVVSRVDHRIAHDMGRALLDPQQTRNAPVLFAAGPLQRELQAQPLCQGILGLHTFEPARTDHQIAAHLLQKALAQSVRRARDLEVEFHLGCCGRVVAGAQVVDAAGLVALEEGGPDRTHQRALARLVGRSEDVEPGLDLGQLEGCSKAPQLGDAQACELHALSSRAWPAWRWASRPVRIASASCDRRAASPESSRSSSITSPR